MKDLKFFCNKIINNHITYLIFESLLVTLTMSFVSGIVIGLILILIITESGIAELNGYILMYLWIIATIILFIYLVQFKLRVFLNLKRFVSKNNEALYKNNKPSYVTGDLEILCRYINKSNINISELTRMMAEFKSFILKEGK